MSRQTIILLSLLILSIRVHADFYDLIQTLRPFLQNYQTPRTDYSFLQDYSLRRTDNERKHDARQTEAPKTVISNEKFNRNEYRTTAKPKLRITTVNNNVDRFTTHRNADVYNIEAITTKKPGSVYNFDSYASPKSNIQSPVAQNPKNVYNFESLATQKANVQTQSTTKKNIINSSQQNNESSKNKNSLTNRRQNYDDAFNNLDYERHSTSRNYERTTRRTTRSEYSYTNRPGVKPAVVDTNRPPITNKPPTTVGYAVYPIVTDSGAIRFPEDEDTSPELLVGPDEDSMSSVDKRRYINLAERMCDKYKALNVKRVEAIPLLPSPEPVQVNVSVCPPSNVPLVVGGKVVAIEEFPHMALLGWTYTQKAGYSWKCGGSLISDQYVLTAGHCAYQEKDDSVVTGAPRVVQLGSSYMDDTGALVVRVLRVVRHPKYIRPSSYYDVALVQLVRPVTFSQVVKPACLGVPPAVGEPIIVTGWGKTEYGGSQSLELRSVSVPIWDIDECRDVLGVSRKMPDGPSRDSQICAGTKGRDACQGDSGGPAQIQDGCAWRVVAVTSVGRSCGAPNTPALYATLHRAFIAAQVFGNVNNGNNNKNNENRPNNRPNKNNNGQASSNRNNNQAALPSHTPNTNSNGNTNSGNSWDSNNQENTNNNGHINNEWSHKNPQSTDGNRNNNWNSNSQANSNGNRNNDGTYTNSQENVNKNRHQTNNNFNSNRQGDYYNVNNNDRTQNYNNYNGNYNYNANNNYNNDKNVNGQNYGTYTEPERTSNYGNNRQQYNYNNNNRDELLDYYENIRLTTKRPNYNSGWFNYG